MQDFYRCDEGYEESASVTSHNRCIKLVKDMHYEAQVQCVINYGAMFLKQKIKKEVARNMKLTREQYLRVHLEFVLILSLLLLFHFSYVIHFITCRCLRGGAVMIPCAGTA